MNETTTAKGTATITCGLCRRTHTSVREVKDCYAQDAYDRWESEGEYAAELAIERRFESWGSENWSPEEYADAAGLNDPFLNR